MTRLSRLGTACVVLFGVAAACGDRTGLPIPVCAGAPLKRVNGPNIYFVLDRSRSMTEETNGQSKWSIVRTDIADLMTAVGSEAQFGAAEFPAPNGSDQCAPGVEVMPLQQGDGLPASTNESTADVFLNATGTPRPFGGTPTADTFTALTPELTTLKGHTFAILATDGGPNCNTAPGVACDTQMCTLNIDQLDPGCTPEGVNCCLPRSPLRGGHPEDNCLDDTRTVAAIEALARPLQGNGVPTFVIGVPGSQSYAEVLDRMAVAGGTARATEPLYYPVDTADSESLVGALADIAARIAATCAIELDEAPADPTQVNVVLDGQIVPQSGANGWTISGNVVTVLGAHCDEIHTGRHSPVVTGGCPTVTDVADAASP